MEDSLKNMKISLKGKKVVVQLEETESEISYEKQVGETPKDANVKPDFETIIVGKNHADEFLIFDNKSKALEYYDIQQERCINSEKAHTEMVDRFDKELLSKDVFDKIAKVKGKLDTNKYKGKYAKLDEYFAYYDQLHAAKNRLALDKKNVVFFSEIIAKIEAL